jgi:hypothetical protein
MNSSQRTQRGASALTVIIILAIMGAGVYIGLQYIPQYMEAGAVDSILGSLEKAHTVTPFNSTMDIRERIDRQLDMNQMDDLRDSFEVTQDGEAYVVRVSFQRELNLIYEVKPVKYEKILTLR